jgi:hypothetical protein
MARARCIPSIGLVYWMDTASHVHNQSLLKSFDLREEVGRVPPASEVQMIQLSRGRAVVYQETQRGSAPRVRNLSFTARAGRLVGAW